MPSRPNGAENHGTPAYGYYEVLETQTHYYITYAFFHPRDYAKMCMTWVCHENDLEGAIFVVDKAVSPPYGEVVMIETLAHNSITNHTKLVRSPAGQVAIFVEPRGHGISGKGDLSKNADSRLFYSYAGIADDPKGAKSGHFGYDLLSIKEELWDRIHGPDSARMYLNWFDFGGSRFKIGKLPGSFAGTKYGTGRANPPWAWMDGSQKDTKRGDWFLDPAYAIGRKLKPRKAKTRLQLIPEAEAAAEYDDEATSAAPPAPAPGVSIDYVHHPYLNP